MRRADDGWWLACANVRIRRASLPFSLALVASCAPASQRAVMPAAPAADTIPRAITDAIPSGPIPSTLGLVIRQVASFPKSEPVPAPTDRRLMRHARINHLGEIPDGSGRKYVPDLNGTMYLLAGSTPTVYLDMKAEVGPDFFSGRGMGSGFTFVTFHPEFATNGRFYTVHSEGFAALTTRPPDYPPQRSTGVQSVLLEWTATDPRADVFKGSRREILRLSFAGFVHGIQQVDFNPSAQRGDGDYALLYVAVGDGGIGVGTTVAQDPGVPYGKILRIDPEGRNAPNGRYGIPASNPFVGRAGTLGEIYASGMRDPHRFSWDPGGNHRMFLAHIGEHHVEAIYDVRAGDNYGWSEREGSLVFDKTDRCSLYSLPPDDAKRGFVYPLAGYAHTRPPGVRCGTDLGYAISGGYVYRGDAIPALRGKYLFGDIVDGRVMYAEERDMRRGGSLATIHELAIFDEAGREAGMAAVAGDRRVDLHIGRDAEGELYFLSKANGRMWKVIGTRPRN